MKISNVSVNLTGSDILSIINDFVKVEGLDLKSVVIDNGINIEGSFKKGIKINFKGTISDLSVEDGKVHCRFSSFKVYKLGLFRIFRSLGVKIALKFIGDLGIDGTKDRLIIDVDKILSKIKIVKLNVLDLYIHGETVCANVGNIDLNLGLIGNNEEVEEVEAENVEEVEEKGFLEGHMTEEEIEALDIEEKTDDYYKKGRIVAKEKIDNKLPEKAKGFSDYIFILPDLVALVGRLLKDDRVPNKTKLTISGSVAYLLFPSDLIPSKIPFIGKIDDLAVLFFALNRIAKDVPLDVLVENWSGKNELIFVLRNGLEYVSNFTGAKNLEKIVDVVEELKTL
ncbi:MAG: YkvA family protein [Clostridium sp.]|uniref:YkvA family protein n=1 Tax=Clostridium sp. TaxID=1506 RepID=UPI003F323BE0